MDKKITLELFEEKYKDYSKNESLWFNKALNYIAIKDYDIETLDKFLQNAYNVKMKKDNLFDYFIADNKKID